MITELCQLIRAVIADDKAKALAYARLLAENLDKDGQPKEATRILRALGDQTIHSSQVVLDDVTTTRAKRWGEWDDKHNC